MKSKVNVWQLEYNESWLYEVKTWYEMRKKAEAVTVKAPILLRRSMKRNEKG